jgi:hypothetical protein
MAEAEVAGFLQEFAGQDLDLPQQTKEMISYLLDQGYTKETLAESLEACTPSDTLRDASADEITEAVTHLTYPEQTAQTEQQPGAEQWPSGEATYAVQEPPSGYEPAVQEAPPAQQASEEEILATLVPALANDLNQAIEDTEQAFFAAITKMLWEAVKARLSEEVKAEQLSGTREQLLRVMNAAAWDALNAAAQGFWEAGYVPDQAGLTGYAALLSRE